VGPAISSGAISRSVYSEAPSKVDERVDVSPEERQRKRDRETDCERGLVSDDVDDQVAALGHGSLAW